jgi:hypothetical protein
MTTPEEHPPKPKPPRKGLISDLAADVIAAGSSIAAGAATAWHQIQSHAYRNMSALDAFEHMKPQRKAEFKEIDDELKQNLITREQSFHKIDHLVEKNERDAFKRMEEFGITSMRDRWNILRKHQKLEVLTWAMVASGVAIGSMLQIMRPARQKEEPAADKKDADNNISV